MQVEIQRLKPQTLTSCTAESDVRASPYQPISREVEMSHFLVRFIRGRSDDVRAFNLDHFPVVRSSVECIHQLHEIL